jgi:hypothetical protein
MASAHADHNSLFGDNTGHTVGGVHDNRIELNTHSNLNSSTMSQPSFQVQAQGSMGGYQQGGAPATVIPGAGSAMHGGWPSIEACPTQSRRCVQCEGQAMEPSCQPFATQIAPTFQMVQAPGPLLPPRKAGAALPGMMPTGVT